MGIWGRGFLLAAAAVVVALLLVVGCLRMVPDARAPGMVGWVWWGGDGLEVVVFFFSIL